MGIPGKTVGTMFTPVPFELTSYEAENVGGGCNVMIHMIEVGVVFVVIYILEVGVI